MQAKHTSLPKIYTALPHYNVLYWTFMRGACSCMTIRYAHAYTRWLWFT